MPWIILIIFLATNGDLSIKATHIRLLMKLRNLFPLACGAAVVTTSASAQLFSDNFDTDSTANWSVFTLGSNSDANFFFDYSTVGIPSAPNSVGGTTTGLRLRANRNITPGSTAGGAFPGGVSVSPTGQSFSGNYALRFDMWLNFNGPAPGGGSGSTQITGAGVGTAGTSAQIAGGVIDSINFGSSAEGGSGVDYRAYVPAVQTGLTEASGVFAAGTQATARNNTDLYYAGFGGESAPAAQLSLYAQQTGTTAAGTLGWAWRDVLIVNAGSVVDWYVDGLLLASVPTATAGSLGGGNILFNHYDINATVSAEATSLDLLFGLIDNVRVEVIPEPTTIALLSLGGLGLFLLRRRRQ